MVHVRKNQERKCKRYAMTLWHDTALCYEHWAKRFRDAHDGQHPGEPWALLRFTVYPSVNHLSDTCLAALRTRMRRGPDRHGANEGDGFIYVYVLDSDTKRGDPWFKIGRTKQKVVQRLDGWPGSRLKRSWRVRWNVFAETLIHRFLEHWRAYRFVLPVAKQAPGQSKRFLSVWYEPIRVDNHTQPVYDTVTDWVSYGCYHGCYGVHAWMTRIGGRILTDGRVTSSDVYFFPKSKRKERYTMEKEWFYCDWDYVQDVIQAIVDVVNAPYERRHKQVFG